jgi:hypothetical protein
MTRIGPVRRGALLVAGLLTALGGSLAAGSVSQAATETGSQQSVARPAAKATPQRTKLTFEVNGCEGCEIQPVRAVAGQEGAWQGKLKTVQDGTVSWTFRTSRTHGLSAWIRGPWEGQDGGGTNYVANVVWRYDHEKVGSTVTRKAVRSKHRATGCWAGTDATAVTVPLEVRKVMVQGTTGRTAGTLAWTKVTQAWWRPMLGVHKGILGTQDVMPCKRP